MSEVTITGDPVGIKLWNLIAASTDPEEARYREQLNGAAMTYGKVYFTDLVTQREEQRNQTSWCMEWLPHKSTWRVSLFMVPEGTEKANNRLKDPEELIEIEEGWEDINPDDIIS